MIGTYIITRMFSLITRTESGKENTLTLILAGVTIIVTIFGIITLFSSGNSLPNY